MSESPDGTIYLGTNGSGLYSFNPEKNNFKPHSDLNIRYCYNIAVTPRGYIAISNENGLLVYHPKTKEIKMVDTENQLHLSATK